MQGCGLGRDVAVSRRSRDVLTSRLGQNPQRLDLGPMRLGSRSRSNMSRSRPIFVSGHCVSLRRFVQARAVHTVATIRAILTSMTFVA